MTAEPVLGEHQHLSLTAAASGLSSLRMRGAPFVLSLRAWHVAPPRDVHRALSSTDISHGSPAPETLSHPSTPIYWPSQAPCTMVWYRNCFTVRESDAAGSHPRGWQGIHCGARRRSKHFEA